ncbi:hypothetical protein HMPREF1326_01289 [Akkermansia sp. KLE1605]|nr:hypothetical protein HMPREF1326_01289 [Akkermansia sp. KLE1605]
MRGQGIHELRMRRFFGRVRTSCFKGVPAKHCPGASCMEW